MRAKVGLRLVNGLTPSGQDRFVWDTETAGFGLKITGNGRIVYILQSRVGGRLRRYTIGRHGAPWTPDTARREAITLLGKIAEGNVPESARQKQHSAMTVTQLCDLYLIEGCTFKKPSTIATDRGRIERHVKRLLGSNRLAELRRADIERFLINVAEGKTAGDSLKNPEMKTRKYGRAIVKGGRGTATRTVGLLGAIFQFAIHRGLIEINPARGVRRYPDRKCERFLSSQEINSLGTVLTDTATSKSEDPYAIAAIRFLLLTGCRRGEALSLLWSWVDFANSVIRFPDSKTGAKIVPIGAPVLSLLSDLPKVEANLHVFPARNGKGPLPRLPEAWERIKEAANLDGVRLHDLRHSFASVGASGGDSLLMIGKLLGHRTSSSTLRYAHLSDNPLKATADRIAGEIAAKLDGLQSASILPIRRTAL